MIEITYDRTIEVAIGVWHINDAERCATIVLHGGDDGSLYSFKTKTKRGGNRAPLTEAEIDQYMLRVKRTYRKQIVCCYPAQVAQAHPRYHILGTWNMQSIVGGWQGERRLTTMSILEAKIRRIKLS